MLYKQILCLYHYFCWRQISHVYFLNVQKCCSLKLPLSIRNETSHGLCVQAFFFFSCNFPPVSGQEAGSEFLLLSRIWLDKCELNEGASDDRKLSRQTKSKNQHIPFSQTYGPSKDPQGSGRKCSSNSGLQTPPTYC